MARSDSDSPRDPESKRNGSGASARSVSRDRPGASWTARVGRSGYGMESIRPHLRAQLEQQRLLRPSFPEDYAPDADETGKP